MNQTSDQNQAQGQNPAQGQNQDQAQGQDQQQGLAQPQGGQNLAGEGGGAQAAAGTTRADLQRTAQAGGAVLLPPVDVIEDAGGITLLADLPGVSKEGLQLHLETNSLTINGELTLDVPQQMDSRYAEVKHQHYQRTFALSKDLDPEKAVAELNNGVLKLRIPKASHAQPRKIEINVA